MKSGGKSSSKRIQIHVLKIYIYIEREGKRDVDIDIRRVRGTQVTATGRYHHWPQQLNK